MCATAMVMPRAFSSGALSMESKDRNFTFGLCLASVLVMAAVSVVLPWSMWPIVPMLTCGLLRSNFSFAINLLFRRLSRGDSALIAVNYFLSQISRHFLVLAEVHGKTAT